MRLGKIALKSGLADMDANSQKEKKTKTRNKSNKKTRDKQKRNKQNWKQITEDKEE